ASYNDATENEFQAGDDADASSALKAVQNWFFDKPQTAAGVRLKSGGTLFNGQPKRLGPADGHAISTVSLSYDETLDWNAFGVWLSMLVHGHGEKILRLKGILNVKG